MNPTIITGGAGFIGFHTAHALLSRGQRVTAIDNLCHYYPTEIKRARIEELRRLGGDRFKFAELDICDREGLNNLFQEESPEAVCHLAAQAGVRYSITHPHAYQQANLEGFLNMIEACRHHGNPRFVYASSSSVYGGNTTYPFRETDPVNTPISLYAATKRANELIAHTYTHLYNLQTIGLRFFTVYGPWGRPDMALWIFAEKILRGEPIPVFNQGKMKRDFTYIDDIVQGVTACLSSSGLAPYELFNLGNHKMEQLMDMIGYIEEGIGKKATLDLMDMQPGDVPASYASVELAHEKLGYQPTTDISSGINKFCSWYLEQPELADCVHAWRNADKS